MKGRRIIQRIGLLCIIGGVLLMGGTLLSNIYHNQHNQADIAAFETIYLPSQGEMEALTQAEENELRDKLAEENILCILEIPKIDSKELVREGSDSVTLSKGLGHMEGTVLPGEMGNFVVAGHRNYTFGRFFNRLDEVELGDEIYAYTMDNMYTYEVTDIQVVTPDQISILEDQEGATITLFTCTPIYIATHRLVITATLTHSEKL